MSQGLFGPTEIEPHAKSPGRRDHLTFRGNLSLGRHGWLRLTPAYSLHLVRELLKNSSSNEFVLEPFSGTGTTPLACAALGIRCHAVEINPFLVWLGNLKLASFEADTAQRVKAAASQIAAVASRPDKPAWKPNLYAIEKWWDAHSLHTLAVICQQISILAETEIKPVVDLLRVAFCRVLIQTANVSFGHQSMSFKKRTEEEPRLHNQTTAQSAGRVASAFLIDAIEVADSLSSDPPQTDCRVMLGDSRNLATAVPDRSYTRVITSPPYPNRMSYIRELRPYMYWLGYLSSGRAAGELDWKAIGGTWGCATSLLNTWMPNEPSLIPFPQFGAIVRDISHRHALLGRYVHKYFHDIKCHILSLRTVLAAGASCHYIVGNSKFYDTILPVEKIYAALFEDAGMEEVSIEIIRKRSSKKELFEFVVHARMPLTP